MLFKRKRKEKVATGVGFRFGEIVVGPLADTEVRAERKSEPEEEESSEGDWTGSKGGPNAEEIQCPGFRRNRWSVYYVCPAHRPAAVCGVSTFDA